MVSTHITIRNFGGKPSWPLDRISDLGLGTVPGFVLEFGDADLAAEDTVHDLPGHPKVRAVLGHRGGHASVQWKCRLHLPGLARRFALRALDGDAPAEPLERKRFVERFAVDVCGLDEISFMEIEKSILFRSECSRDRDLPSSALGKLTDQFLKFYAERTGTPFPVSMDDQLTVILDRLYQAIALSGTGQTGAGGLELCVKREFLPNAPGRPRSVRLLSRDPLTGRSGFYAVQRLNRGEGSSGPVGAATAEEITDTPPWLAEELQHAGELLRRMEPGRIVQLDAVVVERKLLADSIVTLEESLEARIGIAAEAAGSGRIDLWRAALGRLAPDDVELLLTRRLDLGRARSGYKSLGVGTGVAVGAGSGLLCTRPETAVSFRQQGLAVIYVAESPGPQHIAGVVDADALIFAKGGMTSHIAVIARGSGQPCVMGVAGLTVDPTSGAANFGDEKLPEGSHISVDGSSGAIYSGELPIVQPAIAASSALDKVLERCDAEADVVVYGNADNAAEARTAFLNGARGIGLCRLEHLLGAPRHLPLLQEALIFAVAIIQKSGVLAHTRELTTRWGASEGSQASLTEIEKQLSSDPVHTRYRAVLTALSERLVTDLLELFREAGSRLVVVRLLDAPGNEFLPARSDELLDRTNLSPEAFHAAVDRLCGADPMMGLRGCRLSLMAPELTAMQLDAIMEAAARASADGPTANVDIMVPFVSSPGELQALRTMFDRVRLDRPSAANLRFGAMVETPRAALLAGELARMADFLSLGTNDLAQFVWACSRDSAEAAFARSIQYEGLDFEPFERFDEAGLGELVTMAISRARMTTPNISVSVCGEFGADEDAMGFFARHGITLVSCAASRVIAARLAAGRLSVTARAS